MHDTLVATILNFVPETLSDFIDNVLQDEPALVESFIQAEFGIIRQAIIRLKSEKFAQVPRAFRVVSQVAIATDFLQSALSYISRRQRDSVSRV